MCVKFCFFFRGETNKNHGLSEGLRKKTSIFRTDFKKDSLNRMPLIWRKKTDGSLAEDSCLFS